MTTISQPLIIALNGSPHRRGNTAALMQWVLEGCEEVGAEVEWLHVIDYEINYCQGCFTCLRTGECPIQDDYLSVREMLLAADGIVVGSPVYGAEPTAQLKTLLDRLTLLNLYTHTFEGKWSVGVATSGVAPTKGLARRLAGFFGRCCGMIGAKTTTLAEGYQPLAEVHDARLPERAGVLGRRLVSEIAHPNRLRWPRLEAVWHIFLRRFVIRRLILGNTDQFAAVIPIWEEKGWL